MVTLVHVLLCEEIQAKYELAPDTGFSMNILV